MASSRTERAFPVAKKAVESMMETITLLGYDIVKSETREIDEHLKAFEPASIEELQHQLATNLHSNIINFAWTNVKETEAEMQLNLYTKLASALSASAILEVQEVLGVEVTLNLTIV